MPADAGAPIDQCRRGHPRRRDRGWPPSTSPRSSVLGCRPPKPTGTRHRPALASLGYRFDGRGGWDDQRYPVPARPVAGPRLPGLDPMRIRHWPTADEITHLYAEVAVAADEHLAGGRRPDPRPSSSRCSAVAPTAWPTSGTRGHASARCCSRNADAGPRVRGLRPRRRR